jgi:hypothetical protein
MPDLFRAVTNRESCRLVSMLESPPASAISGMFADRIAILANRVFAKFKNSELLECFEEIRKVGQRNNL